MTEEAINRACAELCGWRANGLCGPDALHHPTKCACFDGEACKIPRFTQSLDAAQLAFKALTDEQKASASAELGVMLELSNIFDWSLNDVANVMLATPLQWCEAILRAAGLWKEKTK